MNKVVEERINSPGYSKCHRLGCSIKLSGEGGGEKIKKKCEGKRWGDKLYFLVSSQKKMKKNAPGLRINTHAGPFTVQRDSRKMNRTSRCPEKGSLHLQCKRPWHALSLHVQPRSSSVLFLSWMSSGAKSLLYIHSNICNQVNTLSLSLLQSSSCSGPSVGGELSPTCGILQLDLRHS